MTVSKPSLFSMTMISVSVLFVTGCLAGVRIPDAYSQQQVGSSQARTVSVTSKSTNAPQVGDEVSFPGIINNAMKKVQSRGVPSAKAPTVLPTAVPGFNHLDAKVTLQTKGSGTGYNVLFSSVQQRVADFSGNVYQTTMAARAGTFLTGNTLPQGAVSRSVKVGSVEAKSVTYNSEGKHSKRNDNSFALLEWTQNRWSITVRKTGSSELPLPEARKVSHFLQTHGLPTPRTQAALLVTVKAPSSSFPANLDGQSVSAYVVWQEGKHVYETDAYAACEEPIETAFSMARSMQTYR